MRPFLPDEHYVVVTWSVAHWEDAKKQAAPDGRPGDRQGAPASFARDTPCGHLAGSLTVQLASWRSGRMNIRGVFLDLDRKHLAHRRQKTWEKGLHDGRGLVNYSIPVFGKNDSSPPGGREWRYEQWRLS